MSFEFTTFLKFSPVHNLPFWRKKGRIEMDSSHLNHWIFPKIIQQSSFSTSNVTFHGNLKQKKKIKDSLLASSLLVSNTLP